MSYSMFVISQLSSEKIRHNFIAYVYPCLYLYFH